MTDCCFLSPYLTSEMKLYPVQTWLIVILPATQILYGYVSACDFYPLKSQANINFGSYGSPSYFSYFLFSSLFSTQMWWLVIYYHHVQRSK